MKQSSAFKRLLETLLLAIKMCTGFTTDVIWVNTFSKSIGLNSLYLGPLVKECFLKKMFSMIYRSPVTICSWCLAAKGSYYIYMLNYLGLSEIYPNLYCCQTYWNWKTFRINFGSICKSPLTLETLQMM